METLTPTEYYDAFRERLKAARLARGLSQSQMATLLGMSTASYKKYEVRDKFPLHFIERLALATDRPIEFWITGKNIRQLVRRPAER